MFVVISCDFNVGSYSFTLTLHVFLLFSFFFLDFIMSSQCHIDSCDQEEQEKCQQCQEQLGGQAPWPLGHAIQAKQSFW